MARSSRWSNPRESTIENCRNSPFSRLCSENASCASLMYDHDTCTKSLSLSLSFPDESWRTKTLRQSLTHFWRSLPGFQNRCETCRRSWTQISDQEPTLPSAPFLRTSRRWSEEPGLGAKKDHKGKTPTGSNRFKSG